MERYKLMSVVYLILIKDNKIFLIRRAHTGWNDGNYTLPGGHLDGGESVTQAMAREAREEAGIIIDPKDLSVVHVSHRTGNPYERIEFFMTADKYEGEPGNAEPEKCDDAQWFPLDQLPENMIAPVRAGIANHLAKIAFSEFGWDEPKN